MLSLFVQGVIRFVLRASPIAFSAESGDTYDGTAGDGHTIAPGGGGTIYKCIGVAGAESSCSPYSVGILLICFPN